MSVCVCVLGVGGVEGTGDRLPTSSSIFLVGSAGRVMRTADLDSQMEGAAHTAAYRPVAPIATNG